MFYGKGFQDFQVTTIFSMSLDLNRKIAKTQTAYSTRYCKHCEHLKIIRMQNLKQQFLEICFIMNIKVMMAQAYIFIHFSAVVLLLFVKTVIACFGL